MKKVWILVIAALIALPAMSGIAAAAGHEDMENHGMHHELIGTFQYSDGKVIGNYVNFTVNPRTGEIKDYSVNNVTVFSSINYQNSAVGKVRISGAKFFYFGAWEHLNWSRKNMSLNGGWRLVQALDTPVGVLHIVTHGSDVITYTLAPGINATVNSTRVMLTGVTSAYMFVSHGNVSLDGNKIVVNTGGYGNEEKHYTTSVLFIEPRMKLPKEMKNVMMSGFEKGKIGGEMYIGPHGAEFINYTSGMHAQLAMRERNHIRINIYGNDVNGSRIMIINIENGTLNYTAHHKLMVKFDGKPITECSAQELLNGGTEAKYSMSENNGTITLMVYVPHFSEHTLDVESEAVSSGDNSVSDITSNPMLWIGGAIIIVAIIGVAAWKIRRH